MGKATKKIWWRKEKRGGYNGHYNSYAKSASGYEPQQDSAANSVWGKYRNQWEGADAEYDANYVPGASSWERNYNQWPGHADDPPPMVEAGDMVVPDCVVKHVEDMWTTPFTEDSTQLLARDDVPDVHSPPSGTLTQPEVTPDVQSLSSGDITPPLLEQAAGDQLSPEHVWIVEDDKRADFCSMD